MMRRTKYRNISDRTVEALRVKNDMMFWDRRLPGFGVRAYPSGAKAYIVQAHGPLGTKRVTLGRHGVIQADEARRRAAAIIARIRAGDPPEKGTGGQPGGPTVAEVAKRYLNEHVAVRCKPSTVQRQGTIIHKHLIPAIGDLPLAAVRREDVADLHHRLADIPTQANQAIGTLSRVFNKAQLWGLVPEDANPCRHMPLYRRRKRERFLTDTEFARLGQVLEEALWVGGANQRAITAIRLLMLTGCRKREILTLRWADVDLKSRELRLRDSKVGPRVVPLSPSAVKLLAGLPRMPGNEWVFPGRKPGASLNNIDGAWRVIRERAGLADVRVHDLRHSFASSALALGESLPTIQKLLGHKRISSTVRYAHLARTAVHEAANRVANSLAEDIL